MSFRAQQVIDWLDAKCKEDDNAEVQLQVNVVSFKGGRWYVPDELRANFVRLYKEAYLAENMQYLNFIAPGRNWNVFPYMDLDFPRSADFQKVLTHNSLSVSEFYVIVRDEFGKALGIEHGQIASAMTFCRKAEEEFKCHLICHDGRYMMERGALMLTNKALAQRLVDVFHLRTIGGSMQKFSNATKRWEDEPWVKTNKDETEHFAAFIDASAGGVRPIGSGKFNDTSLKHTYHVYDIETQQPVPKTSLTDAQWNATLITSGNDNNRTERASSATGQHGLTTVLIPLFRFFLS